MDFILNGWTALQDDDMRNQDWPKSTLMHDGFDDGPAVGDENDRDVDDDVVDDIHLWSLHQDTSGAGRPPSTAQVNDNSWVTT